MFPTIQECSDGLKSILEESAAKGETIEVKEVLYRYTTDVISSCAFGIQSNALKDPDADFLKMGKKFFEPTFSTAWRNTLSFMAPDLSSKLKVGLYFFHTCVRKYVSLILFLSGNS